MKPIYITQSGKLGTAAQTHAWTSFGEASGMWGTLTDEQYEAWDEAAKKEKRRRRWRAARRLTGQNLFTEINSHQAFLGLLPFLYPPERPAFTLARLGPLLTGEGRGGVTLKLGVPQAPEGHVLVFGALPCSPGRRYCDKFSYLGLLPAQKEGVSEISTLYYERHGVPPPGSRVIILMQQQVNGWRDIPRRLDVVVPLRQGPVAQPKRRRATAAT
jgi:hypothetical protein